MIHCGTAAELGVGINHVRNNSNACSLFLRQSGMLHDCYAVVTDAKFAMED
jgi:hypothetical protein